MTLLNGLSYEGGSVMPGETKRLKINYTDTAWKTYRLTQLSCDPDSRFFGRLIFFFDDEENCSVMTVGEHLFPVFI